MIRLPGNSRRFSARGVRRAFQESHGWASHSEAAIAIFIKKERT